MSVRQYLGRNDASRFLLGINYWPRSTGPLMWRDWRPHEIAAELREMAGLGIDVCRFFLFTPDFMPEPDVLDETMLARLDEFLALCRAADIATMPTFFVGHMSGENWDLPWRGDRDFYSDPFMLRQQAFYVQTIASRCAGDPTVIAWLLSNEITNYVGNAEAAGGRLWAETLCRALREVDPVRPIGIGDGCWEVSGRDNGLRLEEMSQVVDFLGPHLYHLDSDALRHSLRASFLIRATDYGLPTLLEEFGCSTAHASYEHQAAYFRTTLHSTLLAGAAGAFGWCFSDFDLPYQRPYSHHPHEMQFGITTARGERKPAALEFLRLASLLRRLDLPSYEREQPQTYVVVPSHHSEWRYPFWGVDTHAAQGTLLEAYVLAKQAHLAVDLFREPSLPMTQAQVRHPHVTTTFPATARLLLLPHCQSLTAPTYLALQRFAARGGTVYLSYHTDMGAHNFEELTGCRHLLRYGLVDVPEDEVALTFVRSFGLIKRGEILRYHQGGQYRRSSFCPLTPLDAIVLAVDGQGNPAILLHRVGAGQVIFSAYPLEYYLLHTPEAHQTDRTYLLYQALAAAAGIHQAICVDDPFVESGLLQGAQGSLLWLINHSWEHRQCQVTTAAGGERFLDYESGEEATTTLLLAPKQVRVLHVPAVPQAPRGRQGTEALPAISQLSSTA